MRTTLAVLAALLIPPAHANDHRVEEDTLLMYVRPTGSYVLLHCADTRDCEAKLVCYDRDGEPLELDPVTVRTRRNHQVGMYKALRAAGMTHAEAQRSTTCEVRSEQELHVRAYTRIGGTLVPVHGPLVQDREDPHPLDPDPGPSSPDHLPAPKLLGAEVARCTPSDQYCRLTYKVLVWFEWDVRYYTRHKLYRSTDRSGQNLHGVNQDDRISTLQTAETGEFTRISGAKDPIPENGETYYYWVSVNTGTYGSTTKTAGPVEVRIPAQ